uniref:Uncharacterized protein n=1 Tax=uncultured prokaryote TaxID=198431 RepID=A0A0H5Q1T1_9ZZZZ|nr:hypothetical protein [uncultured prokaryote]
MKHADQALPGLEPAYVRVTLERQGDDEDRWKVVLWAAQSRGFLSAPWDVYEDLTWGEACDVVGNVLDVLGPA